MSSYGELEKEQDNLLDEKEKLEERLQEINDRLDEISNILAREDEKELNRQYWADQF